MCRREHCCQVSGTEGEMVAVYNVLYFNHLVFQRTRLVEGLQAGLKLIHKYLKCSIHFVKIVMKRKE